MPMMAAYAARIPVATTSNTVKKSTKALNKPPKVSPNFPYEVPLPRPVLWPVRPPLARILNLPALTLSAIGK
ncbi:MAG: hypothetical protein ACLPOO_20275 [Terriglobales bacterium]|jgi:hypothetical protein